MGEVWPKHCETIHKLVDAFCAGRRRVQIMEICGTHTMAIARSGLRSLLPEGLKLISGPGCPVCVTDQAYMDQAVELARRGVVVATYGDMIRVPGRLGSLAEARSAGGSVEVVASAEQALALARKRPQQQVVFLGVGFETTAPGTALAVLAARREGLGNFSVLTAHKLILPVMEALLAAGDVQVDGFLCPGHVSVIIGYRAYEPIAQKYGRPCVVAGFDPPHILAGLATIMEQLVEGAPQACTVYPPVSAEGNPEALKVLEDVFVLADAAWRAIGTIPGSGLRLKDELADFDAAKRMDLPEMESYELPGCRCGDVICGRCEPTDCSLFDGRCTPRSPVGPCMVSSEGACAAAFKYGRGRRQKLADHKTC